MAKHTLKSLRCKQEGKTSSKDFGGFKNFIFESVTKHVPLNKIES